MNFPAPPILERTSGQQAAKLLKGREWSERENAVHALFMQGFERHPATSFRGRIPFGMKTRLTP
jgi:hypothetical protein